MMAGASTVPSWHRRSGRLLEKLWSSVPVERLKTLSVKNGHSRDSNRVGRLTSEEQRQASRTALSSPHTSTVARSYPFQLPPSVNPSGKHSQAQPEVSLSLGPTSCYALCSCDITSSTSLTESCVTPHHSLPHQ